MTQIELSADFGLAESNVNRTIQKVENALIRSRVFALPKRNQNIADQDFVIIDVTESPIERPKKTDWILQRQKEEAYLKNTGHFNPKLNQIVSIQIDRGRVHDLSIARKHVKELYTYRCIMGT